MVPQTDVCPVNVQLQQSTSIAIIIFWDVNHRLWTSHECNDVECDHSYNVSSLAFVNLKVYSNIQTHLALQPGKPIEQQKHI